MPPRTFPGQLREATRALHERLEATAYAEALVAGRVTERQYVAHLRAFATIHATLERCLDAACADDPAIAAVWRPTMRRYPALVEDLGAFRLRILPDVGRAVDAALQAASDLRLLAESRAVGLLGALYVLEGSRRGAAVLAPRVAAGLGLAPGSGLTYLGAGLEAPPVPWDEVTAALDEHVKDDADRAAAIAAAVDLFGAIEAIFEALEPIDESDVGFHVTGLNPESGAHAMPQEPDVIRAVLRASDRCLAEYPYLVLRYGARGRQFTDSDGAWLATLPELGASALAEQVRWLAGVLAARGLPSLLLERHLAILADELALARPARADDWAELANAGARLRQRRDALIPPDAVAAVDHRRRAGAPVAPTDPAASAARALVVAAVADEASGHANAIASLLDWLADPTRFSERWIADIRQAQAAAEAARI